MQKLQDDVRAFVDARKTDWPNLTTSIAYKWLDEGLIDRSITRDLSWGVPVTRNGAPRPGFENKVFYVWFDAPIEYIGSTVEWAEANSAETGNAGGAPTRAQTTSPTSSSWARTTSPSTP
jgi:methionyl-tRNA synthetase